MKIGNMKVPVTLVPFGVKALNQEQNYVERDSIEEYLKSPRWKQQKDARNILVSVTHFLRNEAGSEPGLGANDSLLKDGVIIGCLADSWISKDGKCWEGELEIFDDLADYSESQRPMIQQILRLLKNKVSVEVSCCLSGDWDDTDGRLNYLDTCVGVDFTLNGAFKGAMTHPKEI